MIKNTITALILGALLVGCGTTINPQTEQVLITDAAIAGTTYDLQRSHNADLPYFVAAQQELYSIADSTNAISYTSIDAALVAGKQTNSLESLGLITAVNLANSYISSSSSTNATSAKEAALWLANGIGSVTSTSLTTITLTHKK